MYTERIARSGLAALIAFLSSIAVGQAQDDPYGEDVADAERALRRGEIFQARQKFDSVVLDWEDLQGTADAPSDPIVHRARLGLLRIDLRGGDYSAVEAAVRALSPESAADRRVRLVLVDAWTRTGRYEDVRRELRSLVAAHEADVAARCRLGELLMERGERAEGRAELERVIEVSRSMSVRGPDELAWVARAHAALGGRAHVEQAAVLLVEALRNDADHGAARTLRGRLQFDVYGEWSGAESGEKMLLEALERNGEVEDALVTLYRIRSSNHLLDPQKTELFLDRALSANPHSVPALLERGVSLVDDRRFEDGEQFFTRALAVNPNDKRVLAQSAAVAHLRGDAERATAFRERALAVDPGYSGVDTAMGSRLVALYRFADAVPFFEAALQEERDSMLALHGLAKALVYTGQGERARELLAKAKQMQPGFVNPWRNNMIAVQELLDEEYVRVEEGGFAFMLHRDDQQVLESYLVPFQLEARRVLGEKYGYVPDETVRIEAFHTWDDFSVRTIGFRGFTALGACFGPLITLVSPVDGDLRRNDFMWTATVWHEYTHVLTLALSNSRVPRWLTEGFSVYEERQKNRAWERGMDRELLDAFHNGEIAPLRLLNRLFRGPRILFGYYQGGLIVERLADEYGFVKVLDLLRAYGRDLSTEDAFRTTFEIDSRTFDRRFLEWVRDEKLAKLRIQPRFSDRVIEQLLSRVASAPDDVESQLKLGWSMLQRGSEVDAGNHLRAVLRVDPENPEAQLVYAELLRRRDRPEEAIAAFKKGFAGGADDFDSRMRFGALLIARGDTDAAIRAFQAAKACWPTCTEQESSPELALARMYRETGRIEESMMELTTFCSRTARAYAPRLELAAFAKDRGDRRQQVELLEAAIAIDPFARSVHLDLADAYQVLDRRQDAVRELKVALAVVPSLDRDHLGKSPADVPRVDAPDFRESQAEVCVRLGRLLSELDRQDAAREYLERALRESPDGAAAEAARELLGR